jgi:CRISPR-associated Cas5-like protein
MSEEKNSGLRFHSIPIVTNYVVQLEVEAPFAHFKRPFSSDSYEIPPPSVVEGLFKTVAWLQTAFIKPMECRVCRPLRWHEFYFNNGGPMKKSNLIRSGDYQQVRQKMLRNVCYQFIGAVTEIARPMGHLYNHAHYLQAKFNRRLKRGCFGRGTPFMGTSDCIPTYFGDWRQETTTVPLNIEIEGFLVQMWDSPLNGRLAPKLEKVTVKNGVLVYA